jgi:hypothetical protein
VIVIRARADGRKTRPNPRPRLMSRPTDYGFLATSLPFSQRYMGVPYIRAVFCASLAARRNARPTPVAKCSAFLEDVLAFMVLALIFQLGRTMTGLAVGIPFWVILVLGLSLPKIAGRRNLGQHLARP